MWTTLYARRRFRPFWLAAVPPLFPLFVGTRLNLVTKFLSPGRSTPLFWTPELSCVVEDLQEFAWVSAADLPCDCKARMSLLDFRGLAWVCQITSFFVLGAGIFCTLSH